MSYPVQTFTNMQQLITYINTFYVTNGNQEIDAVIGNNILNALSNFVPAYTVNNGLAAISSASSGVITLTKPISVFTAVPTSVNWGDNVQFEYYVVNATGSNIPITSGYGYVDSYGTVQDIFPARNVTHIAKMTNGTWVQVNNPLSNGALPPQAGHEGEFLMTNGTTASWFSPCAFVTSADFEPDGKTYINTALVNNKILLFWNDIPRFIYNVEENPSQVEWRYISGGGFEILIPGFDANINDYYLYMFLKGSNS